MTINLNHHYANFNNNEIIESSLKKLKTLLNSFYKQFNMIYYAYPCLYYQSYAFFP